ncbi:MAG: fatty acid desaturase [Pseudomonadota bacterium]
MRETSQVDGGRQITVGISDRTKLIQQMHAFGITVIPAVGTVIAVYLAFVNGLEMYALTLFLVFYFMTMVLGITVGFHRLLSHCAFKTGPVVEAMLTIFGCFAFQGPPIYWVSNHRRHHGHSDTHGDIHSPYFKNEDKTGGLKGFIYSHVGWMFDHKTTSTIKYASNLFKNKNMLFINKNYYRFAVAGLVLPALIGAFVAADPLEGLAMGFLWGGLVRVFVSYHATSSVNSIAHMIGSRDYDTNDTSRNNAWLSIVSGGETWHNNHHAFPSSAKFGLKWWQVDLGFYAVCLLKLLGLAWDVKTPSNHLMNKKNQMLNKHLKEH